MGKGLFDAKRGDWFLLDPLEQVCIVTATKHPDAGPKDFVDPDHACCEHEERPITDADISDMHHNGQLQNIRVVKDGDYLGIAAIGRRRTRIIRRVNVERLKFNQGKKSHIVTEPPPIQMTDPFGERGDKVPEGQWARMGVKAEGIQGDAKSIFRAQLSENTRRADYSPVQLARQLADYRRLGATDDDLADVASGCIPEGRAPMAWVNDLLKINDTTPRVKAAVEKKEITVATAATLSHVRGHDQDAILEEAKSRFPAGAPGNGPKARVLPQRRADAEVRKRTGKKERKGARPGIRELKEARQTVQPLIEELFGGKRQAKFPPGWNLKSVQIAADVLEWSQGKPDTDFGGLLEDLAKQVAA